MRCLLALPLLLPGWVSAQEAEGHRSVVTSVRFLSDGRALSAGLDKTLRIWKDNLEPEGVDDYPFAIRAIDVNPEEKFLAVGGFDFLVHVTEIETKKKTTFRVDDPRVTALAFFSSSDLLVCLGNGHMAQIDLRRKEVKKKVGHATIIRAIAVSRDFAKIATSGSDGEVRIWRSKDLHLIATLEGHGDTYAICFSQDGMSLAAGREDGSIDVFDIERKLKTRTLRGHKTVVTGLCYYGPDGKTLLSSSRDGAFFQWKLEEGNAYETREVVREGITCFVCHPKNERILIGTVDKHIRMLKLTSK